MSPTSLLLFGILFSIYFFVYRVAVRIKSELFYKAKEIYLQTARLTSEYLGDLRTLLFHDYDSFTGRISLHAKAAAEYQAKNDLINVLIRVTTQPVLILLICLGLVLGKHVTDLPNSQLLITLLIFYRSAPKFLSIGNNYSNVVEMASIDVRPVIESWNDKRYKPPIKSVTHPETNVCSDLIQLKKITHSFNGRPVFQSLSLNIPKGKLVGLVGKSGSGKSTIINLMLGHLKPDEGEIFIDGQNINDIDIREWCSLHVAGVFMWNQE